MWIFARHMDAGGAGFWVVNNLRIRVNMFFWSRLRGSFTRARMNTSPGLQVFSIL